MSGFGFKDIAVNYSVDPGKFWIMIDIIIPSFIVVRLSEVSSKI